MIVVAGIFEVSMPKTFPRPRYVALRTSPLLSEPYEASISMTGRLSKGLMDTLLKVLGGEQSR
jgi:hypothetical protein